MKEISFKKELSSNLKILGNTGTGKTETVKRIVKQIADEYKVLILDVLGEYKELADTFEQKIKVIDLYKQLMDSEDKSIILSEEVKEEIKKFDFVIFDDTHCFYKHDTEEFASFLNELQKENVKVIATFQDIPPVDIDVIFPTFIWTNSR